tara:strand:+ start:51616 stop:51849 length:234 start_codon:yes stop_codon:yes gene_type:complete
MTELLTNKVAETVLEKKISKALNLKLLKFNDQIEFDKRHIDRSKIVFTENFLNYVVDKKKSTLEILGLYKEKFSILF